MHAGCLLVKKITLIFVSFSLTINECKLFHFLGLKDTTQNISNLMMQVQEKVARDILIILVEQVRDQAFIIDTNQ
jgi:hypothetical protein